MKIVYGPVASWRLGKSLGIDLICSTKKICSFDCIYCQLKHTKEITTKQQSFINIDQLKQELITALKHTTPDVITFSGTGEPTLATNLKDAITTIRTITTLPIAILTNSTLLYKPAIRKTLKNLDIIIAKLDAPNQSLFTSINQPAPELTFYQTLQGIKSMREEFSGKFALQIMFMKENQQHARQLAGLARTIQADEIQLNTPLRPSTTPPLTKQELTHIETYFNDLPSINVYSSKRPTTTPLDKEEVFKRNRYEP